MTGPRILTISHGHPDFSLGGAEISAYNLYKAYARHISVDKAWFIARADLGNPGSGSISIRRENEYLWEQAMDVPFFLQAQSRASATLGFSELLEQLQPDIIHAHHYLGLGLDIFQIAKRILPNVKVILTLHEYGAICASDGQMIKRGSTRLCSFESPQDCHRCFPERSAEVFWVRKRYTQRQFELIDRFVSPSNFLRDRYIQWGLEPTKLVVIENGQSDEPPLPPRLLPEQGTRNRFAFFGQITPYKGLDVLLKALKLVPKSNRELMILEIHGANIERQTAEQQSQINNLAAPLIEEGCLQWIGPYQTTDLRDRMARTDWVVVPSIWWENSPMVIQEALTCGRPLLVSNIGGMAEKVRDGVDGIHVAVSSPLAWAEALQRAAAMKDEWNELRSSIQPPLTHDACADRHLSEFRVLRGY